jgi:hypothetical protein
MTKKSIFILIFLRLVGFGVYTFRHFIYENFCGEILCFHIFCEGFNLWNEECQLPFFLTFNGELQFPLLKTAPASS